MRHILHTVTYCYILLQTVTYYILEHAGTFYMLFKSLRLTSATCMCTNRHVGLPPTVLWMTSAILAMAVKATLICSLDSAFCRCFWYLGRVRKHVLDDVSGVAVYQACIKSKNELQTLVKHLLKTQVQSWKRCHTKYNHTKIPKTTTTTIWFIPASLTAILVVWEAIEPPGMLLKQRDHKLSIRSLLKQNDPSNTCTDTITF